MMHGKLMGRRVVLTGASRGIGKEIVKMFTAEDAEIIGIARDAQKLKELQDSLEQPLFHWIQGDIKDKGLGARVAAEVEKRWGALDLLINNAAIQSYNQGFHDEGLDLLEENLTVNVLAPHWFSHALIPLLKKGKEPRIINVSSGAGTFGALREVNMPAYRLSKYLLNGLSIMYAGDLKGLIDVNALDPGWLKTDLGGPQAPGEPIDGAKRALDVALKPFGTTGKFWHGAEEIKF